MKTVLRNARLVDGELVDLLVVDGRIASLDGASDRRPVEATRTEDLAAMLVLPAMAEPHAHLDKAFTADEIPNPSGDLAGAIDAWDAADASGRFPPHTVARRARLALERLLLSGVTAVRTHIDVGAETGIANIEAMVAVREEFRGRVDLQIVALPHTPMTGAEGAGNRRALLDAITAGADLVGGCPHLDPDSLAHINNALAVAAGAGIGVDLHVDETLDDETLTVLDLARAVRTSDFAGPVTASHCVSLGMLPASRQRDIADEVGASGIAVVALPHTNLYLQGRSAPTATPRGLTPIDVLRGAGVVVSAGADNVEDPFNLVGRSDPLETASLLILAAHQTPEIAYGMVSADVRTALGVDRAGTSVGDAADLVAIDAVSFRGAIAQAPTARRVYKAGRLVASTTVEHTIYG